MVQGDRILRLPEVKNQTGLSRSSIYLGMKEGTFPKSVNLGIRSIGWFESQINEWLSSRVIASCSASNNGRA